jgi:hypothetical protein
MSTRSGDGKHGVNHKWEQRRGFRRVSRTEGSRFELQWLIRPLDGLTDRVQYPLAIPSRRSGPPTIECTDVCRGADVPQITGVRDSHVCVTPDRCFSLNLTRAGGSLSKYA